MKELLSNEYFHKVVEKYYGSQGSETSSDFTFYKKNEKKKITVWKNTKVKPMQLKHEITLPYTLKEILTIFEHVEIQLKNSPFCIDQEILQKSSNGLDLVFYLETKMPVMFMSNRYNIVHRRIKTFQEIDCDDKNEGFYIVAFSYDDEDNKLVKETRKKKKVMMKTMTIRKVMKLEKGGVKMITFESVDMGGYVPGSISNMATVGRPFEVPKAFASFKKKIDKIKKLP